MARRHPAEIERHPYAPCIPDDACALILGSAPPWRFCQPEPKPLRERDVDFYYGSYDRGYNLLWEVLFRVFSPSELDDLHRVRALQLPRAARTPLQLDFLQSWLVRHDMAMADILLCFRRRDRSAADAKLSPLAFTDLAGILDRHPKLRRIYCTSRNRVWLWLKQYLDGIGVYGEKDFDSETQRFVWPGPKGSSADPRGVEVRVLPSPSPVGRIRFPSHQEFVSYLTRRYCEIFFAG